MIYLRRKVQQTLVSKLLYHGVRRSKLNKDFSENYIPTKDDIAKSLTNYVYMYRAGS